MATPAEIARIHESIAHKGVMHLALSLGLKATGHAGHARAPCPIHNGSDRNLVLSVRDRKILWICHSGCGGQGGDALALIAAVHGWNLDGDFPRVIEEASRIASVVVAHANEQPRNPFTAQPIDPTGALRTLMKLCPLGGEGLEYLRDTRCLDPDLCRAEWVGYVQDPGVVTAKLIEQFEEDSLDALGIVYRGTRLAFHDHRLLFPVIRGGVPVYVQGRALGAVEKKSDRWRSMRGSVPCPYGMDSVTGTKKLIVFAEGPIDRLSALAMFPDCAAIGVIGAGSFRAEWAPWFRGREVTLALDPDGAGEKGRDELRRLLLAVGARVRGLGVPEGMDLNSWLCAERAS